MKTICIQCPVGCPLDIEMGEYKIIVKGNVCKRGEIYGVSEFTHPVRSVTSLVKIEGGGMASVKTSKAVPKETIFEVLAVIGGLTARRDAKIGDVIALDVLGTGADILITGVTLQA